MRISGKFLIAAGSTVGLLGVLLNHDLRLQGANWELRELKREVTDMRYGGRVAEPQRVARE